MFRSAAVILLSTGLQLQASAQNFFNERYDSFGLGVTQEGWSVECNPDSTYFVVHASYYPDPVSHLLVSVLVLESNGMLDTISRVPLDSVSVYCGGSNCSARTTDGGFVVGGAVNLSDGTQRPLIQRFDSAGNFVATYSFQLDGQSSIGRQAIEDVDGGFLLCGETSGEGFLIKTDPFGSAEWVRTYGGPDVDFIVSVVRAANGYYLGGSYRQSPGNYQFWILRLDQSGVVIWQHIWGSPFNDYHIGLAATSDGHVAMVSSKSLDAFDTGPKNYYMAKLDSTSGDILWDNTFGPPYFNGSILFTVKEIETGNDLVAAGYIVLSTSSLGFRGILLRSTTDGDSLWMRQYAYHDAAIDSSAGIFHDVEPTPDGGFIAVGAAYGVSQNGTSYGQDVWVVKVDSMGCIEPGCHLITGMETQITNLRDVHKVYPNPVASGGSVTVTLELPQTFKPHGPLQLTVVDTQGRLVRKENFTPNNSQLTLHTSTLPSGIYHLHLSDNTRWISGCKLVVE